MTRLRDEHNQQKGILEVKVYKWRKEPHDRFLFIDDKLYHCCHSLNATGGKLSAIMLMGTSPILILNEMMRIHNIRAIPRDCPITTYKARNQYVILSML